MYTVKFHTGLLRHLQTVGLSGIKIDQIPRCHLKGLFLDTNRTFAFDNQHQLVIADIAVRDIPAAKGGAFDERVKFYVQVVPQDASLLSGIIAEENP